MANLKTELKKKLLNAKRVAFLGIGSELRSDDACGMLVAENLEKSLKKSSATGKAKVFLGGTAPENLTGEVKKFKPTHIVLIDAADLGKKAGTIRLMNPDETGGITFCTHQLPLKIMADYLIEAIGCSVLIIGIQPKSLAFGKPVSKEIEKSVKEVSTVIKEILS